MTTFFTQKTTELKALITLGWPIVITQLLLMAAGVLDTVMAGRASAVDLAGVAIGASLMSPVLLLAVGLTAGLTPVVAQAFGAKKYNNVADAFFQTVWIALAASVVLSVVLYKIDMLIEWFAVDKLIRPITSGYLRAIFFAVPAIFGYSILRSYFDGLGNTRPAMLAGIANLLVNAPLNYIFIYGKLGFSPMGGVGCGWATAISVWVGFFVLLFYGFSKGHFRELRVLRTLPGPNRQAMVYMLKIGVPVGLLFVAESLMLSTISLLLGQGAPVKVAAHQIVITLYMLVMMVPLSIGMALTIRIGNLLGAGELQSAARSAGGGLTLACMYSVLAGLFLVFLGEPLIAAFSDDAKVRLLARGLLMLSAVVLLLDAVLVTSLGALRGFKDTAIPMLIVSGCFLGLCLPVGYLLSALQSAELLASVQGFWQGLAVGFMVAVLLVLWRLHNILKRSSL